MRAALAWGEANVDVAGVASSVSGDFGPREAAMAAFCLSAATRIGTDLELGGLVSFELRGKGGRWLVGRTCGDSVVARVGEPDPRLADDLGEAA